MVVLMENGCDGAADVVTGGTDMGPVGLLDSALTTSTLMTEGGVLTLF